MKVKNPFLFITPRVEDSLVGREDFYEELKSQLSKSLDKKRIVVVNGEFGVGKTFFVKKVVSELEEERSDVKVFNFDFNFNTVDYLRRLPSENEVGKEIIVVIDKFELIFSLVNRLQHKILELMTDLCTAEITVVITTTSDLLKRIEGVEPSVKNYFKVVDVPPMNYEEAEGLVVSRLNEFREEDGDSLQPFSKEELKEIYENSRGNPRMILMLCAALFDEKVED